MTILNSASNANLLHSELIKGVDFKSPEIDFTKPPFNWKPEEDSPIFKELEPITTDMLTTRQPKGSGVFDALMESVYNHLSAEYEKGRFSKDDYVKAYIAFTEASMSNAVEFLIQRDSSYWQAVATQMQSKTAVIGYETAKFQLIHQKYLALTEEAKYANTKMGTLQGESVYNTSVYTLDNLLPAQLILVKEQGESQRAQTLDTRLDREVVKGSIGKQKDLYNQQIDSYKRDSEYKVGKFYVDSFITMKTIDEGLTPPSNFTNKVVDEVLDKIKINNAL